MPDVSFTNVYSYYDAYSNQFNLNLTLRPSTVYKINIGGGIVDAAAVGLELEGDAAVHQGDGEGAVEAKQKINELVREIDRCVALLNR